MHTDFTPTRDRTCKACGAHFEARWPSEKRVYCSRACSDAAQKTPLPKFRTRNCLGCGTEFTRRDWKRKYPDAYCTQKCAAQHRAKTVVGEDHPLWKPKVILDCRVCGKPCEVKPSLVDRFRVCSRKCLGVWSIQFRRRVSTLEDRMAELFADAGLDFERQRKFWRYSTDFCFADSMLIVECDGSYWHSLPNVITSDSRKDAWLASKGWTVLRLGEDDIKTNPGECVERVLHLIDPSVPIDWSDEHTQSLPTQDDV